MQDYLAHWGRDWHVAVKALILRLPLQAIAGTRYKAARRLSPDIALWAWPGARAGAEGRHSYDYPTQGVPALVLAVVSHSDQETRDRDWVQKRMVYGRPGIREYWLYDRQQELALQVLTLDLVTTPAPDPYRLGPEAPYRRRAPHADGSLTSAVLETHLRLALRDGQPLVQCWSHVHQEMVRHTGYGPHRRPYRGPRGRSCQGPCRRPRRGLGYR